MTGPPTPAASGRPGRGREPLSRERVLGGAMAVADAGGITALTIRSLAENLGVKPMSVYYYVANKEEILDGIVDVVFGQMYLPVVGAAWRDEIATRARSARDVLRAHPWATPLLESRRHPGPASLRHHDAVLGALRGGGFSLAQTAHAYAVLDAYVYGHALQESALPFEGQDGPQDVAGPVQELMAAGDYPHLTEMILGHYLQEGYDFADEFEVGLALVLDGLETMVR